MHDTYPPGWGTAKQNHVVQFMFEMMGLPRSRKRTIDHYIAAVPLIPKVEELYNYVNNRLRKMAKTRTQPYAAILYFEPGDLYPRYEDYPVHVSRETCRKAIRCSGMLELKDSEYLRSLGIF